MYLELSGDVKHLGEERGETSEECLVSSDPAPPAQEHQVTHPLPALHPADAAQHVREVVSRTTNHSLILLTLHYDIVS